MDYTVNMYRSAVPSKTKRDSLFQEGLRRLRNMSDDITQGEKCDALSQFMNTFRISGYDHYFRYQLLEGILKRQREIESDVREGKRVKFRSRAQIQNHKTNRLGKHPNTWFLRRDRTGTLKVQSTPGGGLTSSLNKVLNATLSAYGGKVKIVELGGDPISKGLSRNQKFGKYATKTRS